MNNTANQMTTGQFAPGDMQILITAIERLSTSLRLTHLPAHLAVKVRITRLVVECAQGGERNIEKLVDCAYTRLDKVDGR